MTTQQHDEYMNNVKWRTMLFYAFTCGSVLLGMAGMYYSLKSDIKENGYISSTHYFRLDKKIDSLHQVDESQIQSLKDDISNIKLSITNITSQKTGSTSYYNQRKDKTGKISWVPAN